LDQIEALTQFILASEILSSSSQFQQLFSTFNEQYFDDRLPTFRVRVVFDVHTATDEPITGLDVSCGFIRFSDRCIFIRYTAHGSMTETLIHEMAHASTSGEHDAAWVNEMRRLREAGAPVCDCDTEG
jgi:hypothetical protein